MKKDDGFSRRRFLGGAASQRSATPLASRTSSRRHRAPRRPQGPTTRRICCSSTAASTRWTLPIASSRRCWCGTAASRRLATISRTTFTGSRRPADRPEGQDGDSRPHRRAQPHRARRQPARMAHAARARLHHSRRDRGAEETRSAASRAASSSRRSDRSPRCSFPRSGCRRWPSSTRSIAPSTSRPRKAAREPTARARRGSKPRA